MLLLFLAALLLLNTLFLSTLAGQMSVPSDTKPLQLPAPEQGGIKLDLSGGPASLRDQLGPLVINKDGTTSRITNWQKMTDQEKQTTLRIVTKRNRVRLAALKEAEDAGKSEL